MTEQNEGLFISDNKKMNNQSEMHFASMNESVEEVFFVTDKNNELIFANEALLRRLNKGFDELDLSDFIFDLADFNEKIGEESEFESYFIDENGFPVMSEFFVSEGQWNDNDIYSVVVKDVDGLELNLQKFSLMFDNNPMLMSITSLPDRKFVRVNTCFLEKTGYDLREIIGHTATELDLFDDIERFNDACGRLQDTGVLKNFEMKVNRKDGNILEGLFSGVIINSYGKRYFHTVMNDITEMRIYQKQVEYASYHDILTGIYNRRYFEDKLRFLANDDKAISMILADVNGLKPINDKYGHSAGDELLKNVAGYLIDIVGIYGSVSRIGGDEFAIILEGDNVSSQDIILDKMKRKFSKFKIGELEVSLAIGYQRRLSKDFNVYELYREADEFMYLNKLTDSGSLRNQTLQVIVQTLFEKSHREKFHSERVSYYSYMIARALGFDEVHLKQIKIAGLLHDIGKIAVDNSILDKRGTLDNSEYDVVKEHPEVGYKILSTIPEYKNIAEFVLQHHERFDSYGYPNHIEKKELHIESRIIAIADCFDAMTSDRPYRKALSREAAIAEIIKNKGKQFDPEIVDIAVDYVFKQKQVAG